MARNRLAVLVGRNPQRMTEMIGAATPLPVIREPIATGDPAELLRRRPDIATAERRLAAATARIGLNVADAFPVLSLGANIGVRAFDVDALDSSEALNFSVGPQLSWSLTNLIRARQRTQAAEADAAAAFAIYEQTVLEALAETEDALVRQARLQQQEAKLAEAVDAASSAADLAEVRYEAGASDFLNVLDAERVRLQSTTLLAAVRTEIARSQVALFRALRAGAPTQNKF